MSLILESIPFLNYLIPIVDSTLSENVLSMYLRMKLVFPTEESPTRRTLYKQSYVKLVVSFSFIICELKSNWI